MSPVIGGIILIVLGLLTSSLSIKKVKQAVIQPLQAQEILPKVKAKREEMEILKGAGPDLSLLFGGTILIAVGVILIIFS